MRTSYKRGDCPARTTGLKYEAPVLEQVVVPDKPEDYSEKIAESYSAVRSCLEEKGKKKRMVHAIVGIVVFALLVGICVGVWYILKG
jgi:hypothetical protein